MNSINLTTSINNYLDTIRGNKSSRTVAIYRDSLKRFIEFIESTEPIDIDADLINISFGAYLTNILGLSQISAGYTLRHLRYFFEYLEKNGRKIVDTSMLADKRIINSLKPNSRKYTGEVINEDEARLLLNYYKTSTDSNNPRGIRNQLIVDILWETGITITELEQLTREDINWQNMTLAIKHTDFRKVHKNREVKLSAETVVLLKKFLNTRQDQCQALIVSFETWDPYIVSAWPLTSRSVQRIVRQAARDCKINKDISPSIFRSTKYTNLVGQGLPLKAINKSMGVSGSSRQYLKFTDTPTPEEAKPNSL